MKAVKVAILAAPCNVSAAPPGMSAALHTNTRHSWELQGSLRDPQGGWVLYMKIFYGLELQGVLVKCPNVPKCSVLDMLKNHFLNKEKKVIKITFFKPSLTQN